jgi:hypothetical protein
MRLGGWRGAADQAKRGVSTVGQKRLLIRVLAATVYAACLNSASLMHAAAEEM